MQVIIGSCSLHEDTLTEPTLRKHDFGRGLLDVTYTAYCSGSGGRKVLRCAVLTR